MNIETFHSDRINNLFIPDPWNAKFVFLWYNDKEIFHSNQNDLNQRMEQLAASGVTHAITFSCTHFRWSFWKWRDLLTETLAKWVQACHLHGIRIIEHHSATLTHRLVKTDDFNALHNWLRIRNSHVESWPGLTNDCRTNYLIDEVPLSSLQQVDGRTGKIARSIYHGWAMCSNNPDYRKSYFNYLETLYQTGVDGIMTDDVQLFGEGNACACEVCRKLFRKHSSYEMPPPGDAWTAWYGNYNDPSFIAWLDFRFRSLENFHQEVVKHYEGLNLHLLRPNYTSHQLTRNPTASAAKETFPFIHWISVECCFSAIIRYSWPDWAIEAMHRFAVGRFRQIPSGAYLYPDRSDTTLFSWALARSWGGLWQPIQEGGNLGEEARKTQQRLWNFEVLHAAIFKTPKRVAEVGLYESRQNREFYGQAEARSLKSMRAWLQASYRSNLLVDMFLQEERSKQLTGYQLVILNEIAVLSTEELVDFKSFVENGGSLLWLGKTGIKDRSATDRKSGFLADFWGIENFRNAADDDGPKTYRLGRGKLVTLGINFGINAGEGRTFWLNRWYPKTEKPLFNLNINELRSRFHAVIRLINSLISPSMIVENIPADVIVTVFEAPQADAIAVHIVNAAGTFDIPQGTPLGHEDPIPFPELDGDIPVRITLRKPAHLKLRKFIMANYFDPLCEEPKQLKLTDSGNMLSFLVPVCYIKEYGLVVIRTKNRSDTVNKPEYDL